MRVALTLPASSKINPVSKAPTGSKRSRFKLAPTRCQHPSKAVRQLPLVDRGMLARMGGLVVGYWRVPHGGESLPYRQLTSAICWLFASTQVEEGRSVAPRTGDFTRDRSEAVINLPLVAEAVLRSDYGV